MLQFHMKQINLIQATKYALNAKLDWDNLIETTYYSTILLSLIPLPML